MAQGKLKELQELASRLKGRRDAALSSFKLASDKVDSLSERTDLLEHVSVLLRTMVDSEITEGVKSIESLQSEGLQAVFDDQDIRVRADVEISRGKVNVSLVTSQTRQNGVVVEGESLDGFGGAVSTVQSILLRIALIVRRNLRPVLFLDETLPAFDDRYVISMGTFLKTLCAKTGVDILLVTHNQALVETSDLAYRIRRDKGAATFVRIR